MIERSTRLRLLGVGAAAVGVGLSKPALSLAQTGGFDYSDTAQGHTVNFQFTATSAATSGAQGLRLSRGSTGFPVGLTLASAGVNAWDTAELDAFSNDLVLAYDHSLPGDVLRLRQGAFVELGDVVGPPPGNTRLAIRANRAADTATSLLLLWRAPVATKLANYIVAFGGPGPTINFQVTKDGFASFGRNFNGEFGANGSLQAQNNVGIYSTDKDMVLRFIRTGTSTQRWDLRYRKFDNSLSVYDASGAKALLTFQPGEKIGLYGVPPVARQVLPTGSSVDAVITALQNLGAVKQS